MRITAIWVSVFSLTAACDPSGSPYGVAGNDQQALPEGAVLSAVRHAISERGLGEFGERIVVVVPDGTVDASLAGFPFSVAAQSAEICQPTGEIVEHQGVPMTLSKCDFPGDMIELHPDVEERSDGIFIVRITEVTKGLPGVSRIFYELNAKWTGRVWEVAINPSVGAEI